jgi:Ni/Co efflux regulator RcnB
MSRDAILAQARTTLAEFREKRVTEMQVWGWMRDGLMPPASGEKWMRVARALTDGRAVSIERTEKGVAFNIEGEA